MNRVYQNTTGVIAVDSGIRQLSEHSSLLSKVWTIAASGWMQRLWDISGERHRKEYPFRDQERVA